MLQNNEQLIDYKCAGWWKHSVSAFSMSSVPVLLYWLPDSGKGHLNQAKGETETFCAVQRHPLVCLSKKIPCLKMCETAILTSGNEIINWNYWILGGNILQRVLQVVLNAQWQIYSSPCCTSEGTGHSTSSPTHPRALCFTAFSSKCSLRQWTTLFRTVVRLL